MDHLDPDLLTSEEELLKQSILDSARDDMPPAGAREQLLSTLKAMPKGGASEPGLAPRTPLAGKAYLVGLALLIGATGASAIVVMSGAEPSPPPMTAASAPSSTPATEAEVPDPPPLPEAPAPVVAPAPPVVRHVPSAATSAASKASDDDSTLGRELARITAARKSLTGGDAARTLQLLDAYDAEFPKGTFSVEVEVLRIEALARAGRVDEAKQHGERFLAQNPQGVLARRVATTLRSVEPEENQR